MSHYKGPMLKYGLRGWALTNFGIFNGFFQTRKLAIADAETSTGKPWKECRKCYEVRRATVQESPVSPHEGARE